MSRWKFNPFTGKFDIDSGSTSGAPTDARYVVLATNGTLTQERVLTAGTNISIVDNGAGSTVVINASDQTPSIARTFLFMGG